MKTRIVTTLLAAAILLVGSATAASADTSVPSEDSQVIHQEVVPMTLRGYDRSVAEANGFRIEIDKTGVEHSVPVTAAAKAVMAKAEQSKALPSVSPMGTVPGNCGTSTLTAAKLPHDQVAVYTGYSVTMPVSHRFWGVYANGLWSGFTWDFPQAATGPSWYTTVSGTAIGGGWAGVSFGSSVILINGGQCWSELPTAWFG